MAVCVCVCVFIKLHITAQSGPIILFILCHSHWSSQGGIHDTCYENLWSGATEGTHSLYLYNSYLSPEYLVPPPLLPCCSLDYLGWQLLNQPFLFYMFLSFHPCLPRFPHGVYNYFAVSCVFSPLFRPPRSYSRSRYRRPRSHLRYCPRFRPSSRPRSHPVFVYGSPPPSPSPSPPPAPVPVPVLRSVVRLHPRPRSRPRSRSVPVPMTVHVPATVSVPTPDSNPAPDPVRSFLPLGPGYPPSTMRLCVCVCVCVKHNDGGLPLDIILLTLYATNVEKLV